MPKNLGLYNDDLSTPRKKDVDICYSPNNVPPYPVTSVNGQTGDVTVGAELPEHLVRYDTLSSIEATSLVNADTLQGYAANYFATEADVSALELSVSGKVSKSGDTMTGALVAQNNTNYGVAQVRNIIISTEDPSGGNSGDIWIKYSE